MLGFDPPLERSPQAHVTKRPPGSVAPIAGANNLVAATTPAMSGNRPRVYLESASKGSQWNAARSQSMEMSKDFEKNCPGVRVTINQSRVPHSLLVLECMGIAECVLLDPIST